MRIIIILHMAVSSHAYHEITFSSHYENSKGVANYPIWSMHASSEDEKLLPRHIKLQFAMFGKTYSSHVIYVYVLL